jgi:1-acyl-sn-glycerol-3-phosphate acyltransferase
VDSASSGVKVDRSDPALRSLLMVAAGLGLYHRHRVRHLERLGRLLETGRRVIVVSNHALDLVDPLLFVATVCERYGRIPHFIGHENFIFGIPVLRDFARRWYVLPARRPADTDAALRRDGFLMLFPGAGTEALTRDYRREPYRLKWEGRSGFLRLALKHDAEIVFVATVGNDDMYFQSRLPMPDAMLAAYNGGDSERYRGARLQFGLVGPHILPAITPLPVQITHVVSRPLELGDRKAALADPEQFEALHRKVRARCQSALTRAVKRERARADVVDRGVRGLQSALHAVGM